VRKPKEYTIVQMVGKNGEVIEAKQAMEYELEEVHFNGTTVLVRRRPRHRVRRKKVVKRLVGRWPVKDGKVERPARRRTGAGTSICCAWSTPIAESTSGVSGAIARRLRERRCAQVVGEECEYDDPADVFEPDIDGCFRPLADNRAFARALFTDALRRKAERAELEETVTALRGALAAVATDQRDLDRAINLICMARRNHANRCRCSGIVELMDVEPITIVLVLGDHETQTDLGGEWFDELEKQVITNRALIEQRPAITRAIDVAGQQLARLRKQLATTETKAAEARTIADELDERYRIVRPRDGEIVYHPAVKRRMNLEQAVVERKEENLAIQGRTKQQTDEVRRLKCQLEDQKCVRDMLQKRIAEERRMERPNVPLMCKNLEAMKKKEKTGEEIIRALSAHESGIRQLITQRKNGFAPEKIEKWQSEVVELRSQIAELKNTAKGRWSGSNQLTQRMGALAKEKVTEFEGLAREFNAAIQKAQQTKKTLQAQIDQLEKVLRK
jgi:hypothetical protein